MFFVILRDEMCGEIGDCIVKGEINELVLISNVML